MLRRTIEDPAIAWDPSTIPPGAELHELSGEVLEELYQRRHLLQEEIPLTGASVDSSELPELARETAAVRRAGLDAGLGFVILRGLEPAEFSFIEIENVFWRMCNLLGEPFVQKSGDVRFGRVENLGRPPGEPVRYHESGTGGSIHTDSPIMPRVADYVGVLSVRTALQGGRSKFVSIARVHNVLLNHAPGLLEELYQPFYFDRRIPPGEVNDQTPAFLLEPIFRHDAAAGDRGLRLRWQPEYVWEASRLSGVPPLSERQQLALHLLEGVLEDRAGDITVCLNMRPGDIQFLNNHRVAHGRTAFIDPPSPANPAIPDPSRRRLLRRVWVHRSHS
jgi:alpha-ketoglutarate-dependent taurine dioxygenase